MFYNMGLSVIEWYTSVSKQHVENYEVLIAADQILSDLTLKKVPKDFAIVLLCSDGKSSLRLYTELEKSGYTNVYVIDGGYQQIVTERSQL